jgi:CRP-like cAMP-binding protein
MPIRRRGRSDWAHPLRAIPIFQRCTDAELRRVERLGDRISVAPGEVVTSERDRTTDSYLVVSGEASVVLRERSIDRLGAGDVFGELAGLFPGRPPAATVTAITAMQVLVIGERDVDKLLTIPCVAQRLAAEAVSRLRAERRLPCQ